MEATVGDVRGILMRFDRCADRVWEFFFPFFLFSIPAFYVNRSARIIV